MKVKTFADIDNISVKLNAINSIEFYFENSLLKYHVHA